MSKLDAAKVKAMSDALVALAPLASELSKIDKSKLDDSKDKFLVIRMVRLDHLIREVRSGDSLRH